VRELTLIEHDEICGIVAVPVHLVGRAVGHAQQLYLVAQHTLRQHMIEHATHQLSVGSRLGHRRVIQDEAGCAGIEVDVPSAEDAQQVDGHRGQQASPVHLGAREHPVEAVLADADQLVELHRVHRTDRLAQYLEHAQSLDNLAGRMAALLLHTEPLYGQRQPEKPE